jgi:hypothetical protein
MNFSELRSRAIFEYFWNTCICKLFSSSRRRMTLTEKPRGDIVEICVYEW